MGKSEGDGNLDGAEHTLLVFRDNSGGAPHLTHCQLECKEKLVIRSAEGGGGWEGLLGDHLCTTLECTLSHFTILPFSQHNTLLVS